MKVKAYRVTYTDDRDSTRDSRRTLYIVGAATPEAALAELFREETTRHFHPAAFDPVPLEVVPTSDRHIALASLAQSLGVVILDSEDADTVRTRLENMADGGMVTLGHVNAGLAGILADKGSIPLVTETDDGERAVAKAMAAGVASEFPDATWAGADDEDAGAD